MADIWTKRVMPCRATTSATARAPFACTASNGARDRIGIAKIGLHCVDLANIADRLQEQREIRTPHRDPDPVARIGKGTD